MAEYITETTCEQCKKYKSRMTFYFVILIMVIIVKDVYMVSMIQSNTAMIQSASVKEAVAEETVEESTEEEPEEKAIGTIVIQAWQLNVRETPNGKILGTVSKEEPHDYYASEDGWLQIKFEEGYGYIAGRYGDKYDLEGNLVEEANPPQEAAEAEPVVVESQPEQELAATSEPEPQPEPIEEPQPEPVDISSLSTRQLCQLVLLQVTTPDMNAYQKVTAVNNYLCSRMEYDLNYHTTRDAILLGKGRCQGYANAFKSIMTEAGIPTDYVRGYDGGNGTHAWNRVLIDGAYYCVDVTWNDSTGANTWLLMPEAEFNVGKSIIAYNPPGTE